MWVTVSWSVLSPHDGIRRAIVFCPLLRLCALRCVFFFWLCVSVFQFLADGDASADAELLVLAPLYSLVLLCFVLCVQTELPRSYVANGWLYGLHWAPWPTQWEGCTYYAWHLLYLPVGPVEIMDPNVGWGPVPPLATKKRGTRRGKSPRDWKIKAQRA